VGCRAVRNRVGVGFTLLTREHSMTTIADLIIARDAAQKQDQQASKSLQRPIFDQKSLDEHLVLQSFGGKEELVKRLDALSHRGVNRTLMCATHEILGRVSNLKTKFPNFSQVIDYLEKSLILALVSEQSFIKFDPICLGGPPGVGKTHFCRALTQALDLESEFLSCSSAVAEWVISGLDSGFRDSYPGLIAEFFQKSSTANPIFFMDEFEKPKEASNGTGSFHGPFYILLEASSADAFEDNFLKVTIDSSYINWIVTVNDFSALPEPIQSRLTYFHIEVPSEEERYAVTLSVYGEIVSKLRNDRGLMMNPSLNREQLRLLNAFEPRTMRKVLETAIKDSIAVFFKAHPMGIKVSCRSTIPLLSSSISSATQSSARIGERPYQTSAIGFLAAIT